MRRAAFVMLPFLFLAAFSSVRADDQVADGARLFRTQCGTCHSLKASDAPRQGPNLEHVYGRRIGGVDGYAYTPGYREAGVAWDENNLDEYLTNPSKMFPGSTMAYRQAKPDIRKAVIAFLKEQG